MQNLEKSARRASADARRADFRVIFLFAQTSGAFKGI
jgi:hypothetical protein